jgi:hyperosmotically inducible protein
LQLGIDWKNSLVIKNDVMNNSRFQPVFTFIVFILGFSLLPGCGGGIEKDAAIQTRISAITQTNPELQNVTASVAKGVVTLVGQCRTEKDRAKAEKVVKDLDDVNRVVNNITVTENIVVTPDNELREGVLKVAKKFKHVQADVDRGIITLRGEIDRDDLPQLMMDLNALRPGRIENQLVVK